ncbi:MAG: DUF378 domain-containing protein [Candidatus Peribacteraceae bacterium]|nr:DUF378 domain-containing protein [Candidatus Peribacteraceae bacterium]
MRLNAIDWISQVLIIIGALNWGIVGLFGIDVVASALGGFTVAARTVYVLVGIAGIYEIISLGYKASARGVRDTRETAR